VAGALHLQNVNAYLASHDLPNYLRWRGAVDGGRIGAPQMQHESALRALPHLTGT
jgi:hypothetical protein